MRVSIYLARQDDFAKANQTFNLWRYKSVPEKHSASLRCDNIRLTASYERRDLVPSEMRSS